MYEPQVRKRKFRRAPSEESDRMKSFSMRTTKTDETAQVRSLISLRWARMSESTFLSLRNGKGPYRVPLRLPTWIFTYVPKVHFLTAWFSGTKLRKLLLNKMHGGKMVLV